MERTPADVLGLAFDAASRRMSEPHIQDAGIQAKVEAVCRDLRNRACARFILATALMKAYRPEVDIRKPYTEIGDADAYSGRSIDEVYISPFVAQYALPCNPTTAFLTPAFRNWNATLTPDLVMVGRPASLYKATLELLAAVQEGRVSAFETLAESIRQLLMLRDEQKEQISSLLASLKRLGGKSELSSEAVVNLVQQHLAISHSSRLPVLVVAAAYSAAEAHLGERVLPLAAHNAADEQTGALGDVQIALIDEDRVVTGYEMKTRCVTVNDIDRALAKVAASGEPVDNYIFITTEPIEQSVKDYAKAVYEQTGSLEVVILDCIGFLRHYLHLFHRLRGEFLDAYQRLVLDEPASAVEQPLKVAFLALRQAAESASQPLSD
ncbi:MAG: restriction endonuclease, SacI family [Anaerolineae bacterium]|nr:restriction endonuclease, SacI family [Anaerolineae bacterium]